MNPFQLLIITAFVFALSYFIRLLNRIAGERNLEFERQVIARLLDRLPARPILRFRLNNQGQLFQFYQFFLRPPTKSSVQTSNFENNAELLAQFEDIEIPENFCCGITWNIMTTPVYDPAHPQYKFEKNAIERFLKDREKNPFTTTPLKASDLKMDVHLQTQIQMFVDNIKNEYRKSPRIA